MKVEFSGFLTRFGTGQRYAIPTEEMLAKYRGVLPDSLLEFWQEEGWCFYSDGLFWTVNPDDYAWLVDGWITSLEGMPADRYFVIGRTAFGNFYCVRQHGHSVILIACPYGLVMASQVALGEGMIQRATEAFFGGSSKDRFDFSDDDDRPMFASALAKLGTLAQDEVYGFVPMLPMGGVARVEHLQKLDLGVHVDILKQTCGVELMTS
jgi:hypothetical protein